MCVVWCTAVQWYGCTCVHANTLYEFFMRCSIDILMVPNVVTSCATTGMLCHKFNYHLIETTEPYFISNSISYVRPHGV